MLSLGSSLLAQPQQRFVNRFFSLLWNVWLAVASSIPFLGLDITDSK